MKSIRGGSGLGDAIYVQAIVRHLLAHGERKLEVCTAFKDVFSQIGDRVKISEFRRLNVDYLAHYSLRKNIDGTDQFEDCCIQAGIKQEVDLCLPWEVTDNRITQRLLDDAGGRKIVFVQMPRPSMARTDGFGEELLPDCRVIQREIDKLRDCGAFLVQLGAGAPLYEFSGLHCDLSNKTTIHQMFDCATLAHGFLGYVSFFVPLAEGMKKPALMVWSSRGLRSRDPFINRITPKKILHGAHCKWAMDNWSKDKIDEAFSDFLR